ncbi:hypothetical protein OG369_43160 [Streptomyces sp. NBC_01221]|uniref:hypothetical protein n=1 Tax=Streptomyces sp. NBC_01221 TaxID=2903782 RepID=UPI00224DBB4C|nr:hypothetical protein [Streptomyces sp. NBC_01221]MCX4792578.1 hypothetical protein [Streptomyces sp. NBC_01221]
MPETDAQRAQRRGTIALFIASAVLAAVGMALLFGLRGEGPSTSPTATPTTSAPSSEAADHGEASPSPAPSSPEAEPSRSSVAAEPSPVPAPMHEAARAFTIAWAGHDARPGRDSSYDDAARRAAAFADGELAEDLRTHTSGSAGRQQWLNWKERQVQVTVTVLRVSLPDGAPAPTQDSGFAQVIYKVTESPAQGAPIESEQHVALKLRRANDGTWRVTGLPNV